MTPFARMAQSVALALSLTLSAPPALAENVVIVADDPAMAAAIETARRHLPRVFGAAMDADGKAHPALTLKVAFQVEDGAEIIWVANVARAGKRFTAILANEPVYLADLAAGDAVTFDDAMIADWGLAGDAGRLFGHLTTRVLLETMPEDQAAPVRALLSEDPLPAAWR